MGDGLGDEQERDWVMRGRRIVCEWESDGSEKGRISMREGINTDSSK